MEGRDQEIYSKCLFRTISYGEIKAEMMTRNINFSPNDTYYILTLKLRREIVKDSEVFGSTIEKIDEEIRAHEAIKHSVGSRYDCCLVGCKFSCRNHRKYLEHLQFLHHNSKSRLTCQYRHNCSRDFPSFETLNSHVKNVHVKKTGTVEIRQNQLVEQLTNLKCLEVSCGHQTASSIDLLKKHLYTHTNRREEVQCIFCLFRTNTSGSLKSHLSRKHKIQTVDLLDLRVVQNVEMLEE